ncbi:hypothetical protein Tdes44962_MAKER07540 [Teratosphaeria destructans]|uniref:Extracellular membrane protein CFEM domain-containing protein n=1 Tax=Teratosphaeria destructans TaxID=418781 RepID=A0A9W7SZ49_9PEZI|nr:hypothetical protein Tdes44962_MAKER07540 [Teratosphaeria destructans]
MLHALPCLAVILLATYASATLLDKRDCTDECFQVGYSVGDNCNIYCEGNKVSSVSDARCRVAGMAC